MNLRFSTLDDDDSLMEEEEQGTPKPESDSDKIKVKTSNRPATPELVQSPSSITDDTFPPVGRMQPDKFVGEGPEGSKKVLDDVVVGPHD
ncbi:hypothetical protein BT69DRAFT_1279484 [Atractiella rhizophila]|nr:hypothetical protein BT69DRAFT_1284450 [Atractiella rhizophila]KAH8925724.1 hypothetical protein BT69DRAFT_1279484 [Atractiella rhizophila]